MPDLRREMAKHENIILESNSVMRFLRPDPYWTVLDPNTADFKDSARNYLDRADAVLQHQANGAPAWTNVSLKPVTTKPTFTIHEGDWVPAELVEFVRRRMAAAKARV